MKQVKDFKKILYRFPKKALVVFKQADGTLVDININATCDQNGSWLVYISPNPDSKVEEN